MPDGAVLVAPAKLEEFVATVLRDLSVGAADARKAAEIIVAADLRGKHTHGVWFLPTYVRLLRAGGVNPRARPRVVHETAGGAVVDGDAALGQIAGSFAAGVAIRKAREEIGLVAVAVRNSSHFGAAGYYAHTCAAAGLIGIITSNSRPIATAPGVLGPVLGSAPLAYAIPDDGGGAPIVFDAALSQVAGTRVVQAAERGEAIPPGWIVDRHGRDSTDPGDLLEEGAALTPLGGHKGFGLSLLVELLAGVLSGAGFGDGVRSHVSQPCEASLTGHMILALEVEALMDPAEFGDRVRSLRAAIAEAPAEPGAEPVRLPGAAADMHERRARSDGLRLELLLWRPLMELAAEMGRDGDLHRALLVQGSDGQSSFGSGIAVRQGRD